MAGNLSFLILGAGAWGSALALHLSRQAQQVVLWGHSPEKMQALATTRDAICLPQMRFPENVSIQADLSRAFEAAGDQAIVFIVVPSHAFCALLEAITPFVGPKTRLLWGSKGLTEEGQLLHVACQTRLGALPTAVLSGPSFAKEVAQGQPTAVVIATQDTPFGQDLLQAFHSEKFRVYLSHDLIGVQLGGALKNVIAIAAGMADGLGLGANARAALITRGLAELMRLSDQLGAQACTAMGLSGVGDMILTCTDDQSRNRRFGYLLGQGHSPDHAQSVIKQVVEGRLNAKQIMALSQTCQIELPICQQVFEVIYHDLPVPEALTRLIAREPKWEF